MRIEDEIALRRKSAGLSKSPSEASGAEPDSAASHRVTSSVGGSQGRTIEEAIAAQRKTHIEGVKPGQVMALMERLGETDPSMLDKRIRQLAEKRMGWFPPALLAVGLLLSLVLLFVTWWVGLLSFAIVICMFNASTQKYRREVIEELVSAEPQRKSRVAGHTEGRSTTTNAGKYDDVDISECTDRIRKHGYVVKKGFQLWSVTSSDKKSVHIAFSLPELRQVLVDIEAELVAASAPAKRG